MDPIWNHFTCLVDGSNSMAQCKLCLKITTLLGSRYFMTSVPSRPEPANLSNRVYTVLCLILRPTLFNHRNTVFHTPADIKNYLDEKIAEFVFGCNLPFSVVKHPWFNAMVFSL